MGSLSSKSLPGQPVPAAPRLGQTVSLAAAGRHCTVQHHAGVSVANDRTLVRLHEDERLTIRTEVADGGGQRLRRHPIQRPPYRRCWSMSLRTASGTRYLVGPPLHARSRSMVEAIPISG